MNYDMNPEEPLSRIKEAMEQLCSYFRSLNTQSMVEVFEKISVELRENGVSDKERRAFHLAYNSKKKRTRKKNIRRLDAHTIKR